MEDDSIPRWKRALLAAAPPPAPARRPASKREDEEDDSGKQKRSTLANKRAKAPRPSALELLGAIRAPTESLGNAPKAASRDAERLAQRRDGGGARPGPRGRGGHVESRPRRRAAPGAAARAAPARKGAEIDDFHVDEFEGRPAPRAFVKVRPADLPAAERLEAPAAGLDGEVVRAQADVLLHAQGQGFNQVDAAARGEVAPRRSRRRRLHRTTTP